MVRRIFAEKRDGFNVAAVGMLADLRDYLKITALERVRILVRYDLEGLGEAELKAAKPVIFSEPPVDLVHDESFPLGADETAFGIEYLPGQYDQRADSAAQAVQLMTHGEIPIVKCAQIIVLKGVAGRLSDEDVAKIRKYLINPVDSQEASLGKPETLSRKVESPPDVTVLIGLTRATDEELASRRQELGLAMSREDLIHTRDYFRDTEHRDPTITEIRLLDTYWSDHCRHTTFLTRFGEVTIEDGPYSEPIKAAWHRYLDARSSLYGAESARPQNLMDIAVIGMKELREAGLLDDLEVSREVNACSIEVEAQLADGTTEPWLVMFKNETHNHPTEIEPFGGAATCLGGCIRDPLSGRSWVYQAMRVTGAADPRRPLEETLPGKLPQRKITTEAAHGYSSYGNQIGLATGLVNEIYHEGYTAKRLEIGAVVAGAPKRNVVRGEPRPGDCIVLIGGRTGRDGCGGATGSSKEHTLESIEVSGAEVQKGNAPTERKIQRLFRNPDFAPKIKVCNDFGAGGVAVAIGEIADGLLIDLDAIPKKYEGLDGTELAISESQERMAVCIDPADLDFVIAAARAENLEATKVADVTIEPRVRMLWRGRLIVDISRQFINTNGVLQTRDCTVAAPSVIDQPAGGPPSGESLAERWLENLSDLNVCSQKGLVEQFDSTVGAGSVLLPFGGRFQLTPTQVMAAKLPLIQGDTTTGTLMSSGFDPNLSSWSPFHGALYAVVESVARIIAAGGRRQTTRLTLQEYFEKLGTDARRWGKPLAALLGAYAAQIGLGTPAIGGKDSMSGSFEKLDVPPTLVSFALTPVDVGRVISPEFKRAGSRVILIPVPKSVDLVPDWGALGRTYDQVSGLIAAGQITAAHTVPKGGIAAAVTKMCFGNRLGFRFKVEALSDRLDGLFIPDYGALVCECAEGVDDLPFDCRELGLTTTEPALTIGQTVLPLDTCLEAWQSTLEPIFPTRAPEPPPAVTVTSALHGTIRSAPFLAAPRAYIPVFPGTNCEYDTARQLTLAGAVPTIQVINNLSPALIEESTTEAVELIEKSQMIVIPGGFSAGDEPEGSGKFIASFFRNPAVAEAVMRLLRQREGLILGICNGFQALVKLGLLPYGEIRPLTADSPTLTFNSIGRHVSQMVSTRISSTLSPWLAGVRTGDIHTIAVSHGEGRFVASTEWLQQLADQGQIATQYVDAEGLATSRRPFNPNGSSQAIEGITSPDGRVFGKMGHSERIGTQVAKNIDGSRDQLIFESGVKYFH